MTNARPVLPATDQAVVGIDGCRGGWVWCRRTSAGWEGDVAPSIAQLLPILSNASLALIDMPIGLISAGQQERACDQAARALLGRPRASSVFRPPCRAALAAPDYAAACSVNRHRTGVALSLQTWNIAAKIRELDQALGAEPGLAERLLEAHPEVCLWGLSGGHAMAHNKRKPQGRAERLRLLAALDPACPDHLAAMARQHPRRCLAADDILDAMVLAITAGIAIANPDSRRRLPDAPALDARGLPMALFYVHRAADNGQIQRPQRRSP
jgi:predicted RNase H-like nuclease